MDSITTSRRAILCARVSTTAQAERGHSIASQFEVMRKYAVREGMTVVAELKDDVSGAIPIRQRPGGHDLYEFIDTRTADAVVFFSVDRVTRDEDLIEINTIRRDVRNAGIELHYAAEGGKTDLSTIGGMLDTFRAAIAAEERLKIIERTARGRNTKARSGKVIGAWRAPYGYTRNGDQMTVHAEEAAIVRKIFGWYVAGDEMAKPMTCISIQRKLAEMAIPTPAQGQADNRRRRAANVWNPATVRQLLRREAYIGVWRYGKRIGKNGAGGLRKVEDTIAVPVPAIVDLATWQAAQVKLGEMRRMASSQRANKHYYLLRGLVRCGQCGAVICAEKNGKHHAYRCTQRHHRLSGTEGHCSQRRVITHVLEDAVWDRVLDLVTNPVTFEAKARAAIAAEHDAQGPRLARLDELARQIARCDREIATVAREIPIQRGRMRETLQAQADQLNVRYDGLAAEQRKIRADISTAKMTEQDVTQLVTFMRDAVDGLKSADFTLRRAVLELLQSAVVMNGDQATVTLTISDKHHETMGIQLGHFKI